MKNFPLIIIGAGEHSHVLLDLLLEQNKEVIGITDTNTDLKGTEIYGVPVIGCDDEILRYKPSDILIVNGIGSVGSTKIRVGVFDSFKRKGYNFATVVHDSAIISSRVVLKEGVQILAGVILNVGVVIGENTIINTKTSIDHDCKIGSHVHIAPGCVLSGCVSVGNGTHMGTGSTVIQGITIGENSLIGAGSVVVRNVSDNIKVYGVPAKPYKLLG